MKIVGYAIVGKEADRYLDKTLKEFERLCDETIICLNNATDKERGLIATYGFKVVEDSREWGFNQHLIKQDLMKEVAKLNPDYCVCLDADEVYDPQFTRETIVKYSHLPALYFYIVNLWNDGWNRQWSFWNIRAWKWTGDMKFSNRPLHCGLAPESAYHYGKYIPYIVTHYGLMKKEDRQKKIERYQKYDPKAVYKDVSYYNELAGGIASPLNYDIIREKIREEVGSPVIKTKNEVPKMKYYYVKNPQGKVCDVPENLLDETLKRAGFSLVGETIAQQVSEVPEVVLDEPVKEVGVVKTDLDCDICGFTAKTDKGLATHKRKHRD